MDECFVVFFSPEGWVGLFFSEKWPLRLAVFVGK